MRLGKMKLDVRMVRDPAPYWPIGSANLFFRRTTDRYGPKGTIGHNPGYMKVKRDPASGRWAKV